jgi:hypothetical protein
MSPEELQRLNADFREYKARLAVQRAHAETIRQMNLRLIPMIEMRLGLPVSEPTKLSWLDGPVIEAHFQVLARLHRALEFHEAALQKTAEESPDSPAVAPVALPA